MEMITKTFEGAFDPIWRESKVLPGGFQPSNSLPSGAIVEKGTPVEIATDDLTCTICKSANVIEGGDSTHVRVAKGLLFVVGDKVTDGSSTDSGDEGEATQNEAEITAIDTSNSDYDELTLSAALEGAAIYTPGCVPNGVVCAVRQNNGRGILAIDVAYHALVLFKGMKTPIADEWRDGICLKGNHSIKFIVQ